MANTVFVSDEAVQEVLDWKEMVDKLAEAHAAELHADFAPPRTMARGLTGEWTRALCAVPAGPIMGLKFFALAAKGGGIRYCIALFRKTDSEMVALVDANTVTARTFWIPAVNNHGGSGRWAFLEATDPYDDVVELNRACASGCSARPN